MRNYYKVFFITLRYECYGYHFTCFYNYTKCIVLIILTYDITFGNFSKIWFEHKAGLARRSLDTYRPVINNYLIPIVGKIMLKNIRVTHGYQIISLGRKKSLSPTRINFCIRVLKQILNDAIKWDYLLSNPINKVEKLKQNPRGETYWLSEDVQKFLNANKDHPFYSFFLVALNTGMRRGELLGLKWDKVDFVNRQIEIARNRDRYEVRPTTKTGRIRYVPMNNTVLDALLKLRNEKRNLDFVFVDQVGNPLF